MTFKRLSLVASLICALLIVWPAAPVAAQQSDYTVTIQLTESALADTEVKFFANVKEGGKAVQGIRVTFLVGSIAVGTCTTDVTGSCQGGYRFDNPGNYFVTALAGNSASQPKLIRIVAPPTPSVTTTAEPSATLLPGITLPPGMLPTATLILPTLNIPTSTPTSATLLQVATRTPLPVQSTATPTPGLTRTPLSEAALPTFDPGFTPTPYVAPDTTTPIANALGLVALFLAIIAVIITIIRVRKYRQLTRLRTK